MKNNSSSPSLRSSKSYSEKLKDPRWQKKRLEILNRDEWACCICGESENTLHVHHKSYVKGKDPWDYDDDNFETLCEFCHDHEHSKYKDYIELIETALKTRGFHADDALELGETLLLKMGNAPYPPEVIMTAICWSISSDDKMLELTERYFKHLAEKRERGELG